MIIFNHIHRYNPAAATASAGDVTIKVNKAAVTVEDVNAVSFLFYFLNYSQVLHVFFRFTEFPFLPPN